MKLTDEQIDKLFQESAAKESFAYKPEYWEEFSASLSDSAHLSEAADATFDAAFQTSAASQSFDYKPEFWDAFSASLPDSTPLSQAPDAAFDAAFQDNASSISVDYNPQFWSEFSDSLPLMTSMEDVSDAGVDAMYREEAANLSFAYKPSYWEEMATLLRRRRRRPDFLWFGLSGVFTTVLITMLFIEQSPLQIDWNSLEYSLAEINPQAAPSYNGTLASNGGSPINGVITKDNITQGGTYNGTGQAVAQNNVASNNVTPNNGNGSPTILTNSGVTPNGNTTQQANNQNLVVNQIPNNGSPNGTTTNQTNNRLNRITPNLVLTTSHVASLQRTAQANTLSQLEESEVLTPREVETLDQQFDNTLAESNLHRLPDYKGGYQTGMYLQALGGISESTIIPSNTISTSYGVGFGWEINRKNWTLDLGSNLVVENYSDLFLSRFGKEYDEGSFSKKTRHIVSKPVHS